MHKHPPPSWPDGLRFLQDRLPHWYFAPLALILQAFQPDIWPDLTHYNALFAQRHPTLPLHFIHQPPRPRRRRNARALPRYEQQISDHHQIPTRRDNWHDFFNFCSWYLFPHSKLALTARQWLARQHHDGPNRTREQDTLTIFDEGGVVVIIDLQGVSHPLVFGHGIFEHLLTSTMAIRAMAVNLTSPVSFAGEVGATFAAIDQQLATYITSDYSFLQPSQYADYPVMPG